MNERQQEVLEFWFGGDLHVNYHTKWFPDGNGDLQARTDAEIQARFDDLLNGAINGHLNFWADTSRGKLALIIVLDQFSRHIYRLQQLPAEHDLRKQADSSALALAQSLQESAAEEIRQWPVAQMVFALMPFRHNATIDRLEFVLSRLDDRDKQTVQSAELMSRFRKQTVRRLQHLQDRAKLEATDDILDHDAFDADEGDLLQNPLVQVTDQFLKRHMNSLPPSNCRVLQLVPTSETEDSQREFVARNHAIAESSASPVVANVLMISLSGGVDSMVLSKILAQLQQKQQLAAKANAGRSANNSQQLQHIAAIVAVHIDYANRPESGREAQYVADWCAKLGIHCRIRTVNEVTRGITERDAYEKIARNIRYGFYLECIQEALQGRFLDTRSDFYPIGAPIEVRVSGMFFGHHLGDVQENIVSNVMRGASPLYLSGMTETSVTNQVHVWRPLLTHVKDTIYAFAHHYGVPYFKDSTPSWSTRGKLRNQLMPLLQEIYGAGCLTNLSNLAQESDQTRDLVHANLYAPFLRSVRRFACGLAVNVVPYRHQPPTFWREVLKLLMHSLGMPLIRDKAVHAFVERIQRTHDGAGTEKKKGPKGQQPKKAVAAKVAATVASLAVSLQHGWLELRKGVHSYLTLEGDLVLLQDGVLRRDLVVHNPATSKNQALQHQKQQPRGEGRSKKDKKRQPPLDGNSGGVQVVGDAVDGGFEPLFAAVLDSTTAAATEDASTSQKTTLSSPTVVTLTPLERERQLTQQMLTSVFRIDALVDSPTTLSLAAPFDVHHRDNLVSKEYLPNPRYVTSDDDANPSSTIDEVSLDYGPWKISLHLLSSGSSAATNEKTETLKQEDKPLPLEGLVDLLPGTVTYTVLWPWSPQQSEKSTLSFVFLKDVLAYLEAHDPRMQTSSAQELFRLDEVEADGAMSPLKQALASLDIDLRFLDVRLRDGLPWILPFSAPLSRTNAPFSSDLSTDLSRLQVAAGNYVRIRVSYTYCGRRADLHADHTVLGLH